MTDKTETEAAFLLKRAEEETIQALRTGEAVAAAVHWELAHHYSARAVRALAENERNAASDEQSTGKIGDA